MILRCSLRLLWLCRNKFYKKGELGPGIDNDNNNNNTNKLTPSCARPCLSFFRGGGEAGVYLPYHGCMHGYV